MGPAVHWAVPDARPAPPRELDHCTRTIPEVVYAVPLSVTFGAVVEYVPPAATGVRMTSTGGW